MKEFSALIPLILIAVFTFSTAKIDESSKSRSIASVGSQLNEDFFNAARGQDISKVKKLLEEGVDVNYQNEMGRTALMMTAFNRNHELAKILLDYGADKELTDNGGRTASWLAEDRLSLSIVRILKDYTPEIKENTSISAAPNSENTKLGISHLFDAIQKKDRDLVKFQIENGVDPYQNFNGTNAFKFARGKKANSLIDLMRDGRALYKKIKNKATLEKPKKEKSKQKDSPIPKRGQVGISFLFEAIKNKDIEGVKFQIQSGVDPYQKFNGSNAFYFARKNSISQIGKISISSL